MSDLICLPKEYLIIIFCIFIGFAVWYIQFDKNKTSNTNYNYNDKILSVIANSLKELPTKINQNKDSDFIIKRRYLSQRDSDVLYNDFAPPEKRDHEYSYPDQRVKTMLNVPTRGFPDNYQVMGVVLRNNTENAFNLFGRQKYPGSNQYEYYVQSNMNNSIVKIPIVIRGDKEIEDGETIIVPGTDPSKGGFKVKLYNFDTPRYNPFTG